MKNRAAMYSLRGYALILLMSIGFLLVSTAVGGESLPRIMVKNGIFYEKGSGKQFIAIGFNYALSRKNIPGKQQGHATFGPDKYKSKETEKAFTHFEKGGFNLVRVFIDPSTTVGYTESQKAKRLNPVYMKNVIDFLERARRHKVYVMFTTDRWLPKSEWLKGKDDKPLVVGYNNMYFNDSNIRTRARVYGEFIKTIKAHDPGLLSTVFGWQIENEIAFRIDMEPFKSRKKFVYHGKTYDLATAKGIAGLCDDNAAFQAKVTSETVHKLDSEVLVGIGMYPPKYDWYSDPEKVVSGKYPKEQLAGRPLAYIRSGNVQFVDLHIYMRDVYNNSIENNWKYKTSGFQLDKIIPESKKMNVGVIMGEFGANKHIFESATEAAPYMAEECALAIEAGLQGFMQWCYNPHGKNYAAIADNNILFETYRTVKKAIGIKKNGTLTINRKLLPKPSAPPTYKRLSENLFNPEALIEPDNWKAQSFGKNKSGKINLSFDSKDEAIMVKLRDSGTATWSVISPGFKSKTGATYEMSFQVKTDLPFLMRFAMINMWKYTKSVQPILGKEYRTVIIRGTPEQLNGNKIVLKCDVPQESTIYIRKLEVYEVEKEK